MTSDDMFVAIISSQTIEFNMLHGYLDVEWLGNLHAACAAGAWSGKMPVNELTAIVLAHAPPAHAACRMTVIHTTLASLQDTSTGVVF